jgi:hypothetical protein
MPSNKSFKPNSNRYAITVGLILVLDLTEDSVILKFVMALGLACATSTSLAGTPVDNKRLSAIFAEDQAARKSMPIDWAKVALADRAHRQEVLELLHSGNVRTSNDFYRAAMIMQHGESTEDYQLAYSLTKLSATIDPSNKMARWLAAASWDRVLKSKGLPQWYGTQYDRPRPDAPMELYKVDESAVSDLERAEMNVPSLQEAKDLLLQINK